MYEIVMAILGVTDYRECFGHWSGCVSIQGHVRQLEKWREKKTQEKKKPYYQARRYLWARLVQHSFKL